MRIRYECEAGVRVDDPSDDELDDLLNHLDGVDNSYASLTTSDGSYVQVGGGPEEFTVEMREQRPNGRFRHLKAAKSARDRHRRQLSIGGTDVEVRADQVLDLNTVRAVFHAFARGKTSDVPVVWDDMTSTFTR